MNNKEERLRALNSIYVQYPRMNTILEAMEDCRIRSMKYQEARCLFIKGVSGVGKTTLIRDYQSQHPKCQTPTRTVAPVLVASIPAPAKIPTVASRLLKELGDPMYNNGTGTSLSNRLHNYIWECGVELIILDEFQHFIDSESQKILLNVANWLKDLINTTNVPIVLIGMPNSESIFNGNDQCQLSRRFDRRLSLEPFSWETDASRIEFRKFLKLVDEQLPLPERSNLSSTELAYRIYHATDGVMDYVMKLIKCASELAINIDEAKIEIEHLSVAFQETCKVVMGWKTNPFECDLSTIEGNTNRKAPLEEDPPNPLRRGRPRKGASPYGAA